MGQPLDIEPVRRTGLLQHQPRHLGAGLDTLAQAELIGAAARIQLADQTTQHLHGPFTAPTTLTQPACTPAAKESPAPTVSTI